MVRELSDIQRRRHRLLGATSSPRSDIPLPLLRRPATGLAFEEVACDEALNNCQPAQRTAARSAAGATWDLTSAAMATEGEWLYNGRNSRRRLSASQRGRSIHFPTPGAAGVSQSQAHVYQERADSRDVAYEFSKAVIDDQVETVELTAALLLLRDDRTKFPSYIVDTTAWTTCRQSASNSAMDGAATRSGAGAEGSGLAGRLQYGRRPTGWGREQIESLP